MQSVPFDRPLFLPDEPQAVENSSVRKEEDLIKGTLAHFALRVLN